MLSTLLLLIGGAISFYCLWHLKRWMAEVRAAMDAAPHRLERIVDELIATAEAASASVSEKTEDLVNLIAMADERLGQLKEMARTERVVHARSKAVAEPVRLVSVRPSETAQNGSSQGQSDIQRQVLSLADGGHDITSIARQLGITTGEVQFILGLRKLN